MATNQIQVRVNGIADLRAKLESSTSNARIVAEVFEFLDGTSLFSYHHCLLLIKEQQHEFVMAIQMNYYCTMPSETDGYALQTIEEGQQRNTELLQTLTYWILLEHTVLKKHYFGLLKSRVPPRNSCRIC